MIPINRLIVPWLVTLMLFSCSLSALAVEEDPAPEPTPDVVSVETQEGDKSIVVNVTLPNAVSAPEPTPEATVTPEINLVNDPAPEYIPYAATALDETPEANTALVDAVKDLFGDYQPRTQTVTEHLTDGSTVTYQQVIPGLAGLDWPWLVGVGLFALFLYGLLRLLGGLIKL